jgi:hypothetical protein
VHSVKSPFHAIHNALIPQPVALVCFEAFCLPPDESHVQFKRRSEVFGP